LMHLGEILYRRRGQGSIRNSEYRAYGEFRFTDTRGRVGTLIVRKC
jgi:hypothetical protein